MQTLTREGALSLYSNDITELILIHAADHNAQTLEREEWSTQFVFN